MKKVIVSTSINPPTEAIAKFDALKDWELVVIGDLKTPKDYKLERGVYIPPREQTLLYPEFSEIMGWNNDCRRTIGFLYAVKQMGADIVATVDDDNIPLDGWGENLLIDRDVDARCFDTTDEMFDPMIGTNHKEMWYRGFPLQLVTRRYANTVLRDGLILSRCKIQSDFWIGTPDVDAICRMTVGNTCKVESPIPFVSNKPSPFNSQNTFLHKDVLPDYFPFPFIARMCDIWAAYYAQAAGHKVIYGGTTVNHARNVHNLLADMKGEYLGYEQGMGIAQDIAEHGTVAITSRLPERAVRAFEAYRRCYE